MYIIDPALSTPMTFREQVPPPAAYNYLDPHDILRWFDHNELKHIECSSILQVARESLYTSITTNFEGGSWSRFLSTRP